MVNSPINLQTEVKDNPALGLIIGMEGGIEASEAQGQRQLLQSEVLPSNLSNRLNPATAEPDLSEFKALGFVFGDLVEGDRLFIKATLPPGWKREGSSHSMWSYVVDERGIRRVGIFYKAAFYDRDAFMSVQSVGGAYVSEAFHADTAALPDTWNVLTAEERQEFVAGLDGRAAQIEECPSVYGKYTERLAQLRALVEAASEKSQ